MTIAALPHATSASPAAPRRAAVPYGAPPRFPLRVAIVLAVAVGFADFGSRLVKQSSDGGPVGMGPDALWMAPIMNLVWLGIPAAALSWIAHRRPGRVSHVMVLRVLGFVALADLFLAYRRVHVLAELLLALGLAVRLASMLAAHDGWISRVERASRLAARLAVAAFVLSTAGLFAGRWALERRAIAALPEGRAGMPNVLLLVLDTVRDIDMSLYGYPPPTTPHLARWAAQGVRFDRAFATAPWTLPSHASMFTGRLPGELSTDLATRLDATFPTLAEALRDAGYETGSFVGNTSYLTWQYGLTRGFVHTDGYPVSPAMVFVSSAIGRRLLRSTAVRGAAGMWDHPGRKPAEQLNGRFLSWVDGLNARPFFGFVNYYDAHYPTFPPPPFDSRFGPPPSPRDPALELKYGSIGEGELLQRRALYDGAIAYVDQQADRLLTQLQRRGLLDNTIVVIVGDHGEHWGDHRRLSHGNSLYRQLLQVPLVIRQPGRWRAGCVVDDVVSLQDLPATLLELTSVSNGGRFHGAPLTPYADASCDAAHADVPPRPVFSENAPKGVHGPLSIIAGGLHYIRWRDGREELYDVDRDPLDSLDLAATATGQRALARFRATEDSLIRARR
jgi:arylsulfatase A-like enzyme